MIVGVTLQSVNHFGLLAVCVSPRPDALTVNIVP